MDLRVATSLGNSLPGRDSCDLQLFMMLSKLRFSASRLTVKHTKVSIMRRLFSTVTLVDCDTFVLERCVVPTTSAIAALRQFVLASKLELQLYQR
jgi:hypothetical protein